MKRHLKSRRTVLAGTGCAAFGLLVLPLLAGTPRPRGHSAVVAAVTGSVTGSVTGASAAADAPTFNDDVRPILSDHCFTCHGPDSSTRKSSLRLDSFEDATATTTASGLAAIVPGDPAASELIARITTHEPSDLMPPASTKKPLDERDIETLTRWIEAGAEYEPHWAFVAPVRPAIPGVEANPGVHPIDAFLDARLAVEGLEANGPATPERRLRRLTLDLTGLPPTIAELDAFLAAEAADGDAYASERAIERLLESPAHAEHFARIWLDAVRYADTHGLHLDNLRRMWKYRDWVIERFRENQPFDEFTIEQIAGDLLPEPSLEQLVGTGFLRCHPTTSEGGSIDEEYVVRYAVDRVETIGTVWMGMTVGCASCHDHKFDPITQKEFYELFAFFNNTTEAPMDGNGPAPAPVIKVADDEDLAAFARLEAERAAVLAELASTDDAIEAAERAWRAEAEAAIAPSTVALEPLAVTSQAGIAFERQDDGSWFATGDLPGTDVFEIIVPLPDVDVVGFRIDALKDDRLPYDGPGGGPDNGNFVLNEIEVAVARELGSDAAEAEIALTEFEPLRFANAVATRDQPDWPATEAIDGVIDPAQGWAILDDDRVAHAQSAVFLLDDAAGDAAAKPLRGGVARLRLHFVSPYRAHQIARFAVSAQLDASTLPAIPGRWYASAPMTADSNEAAFALAPPPGLDFESRRIDASLRDAGDAPIWTPRTDDVDGAVNALGNAPRSARFLAREWIAPTDTRATLRIGSDDAVKVWIDGELVHENFVPRGAAPAQDTVEIDLSAGRHLIVLQVVNFGGPTAYAFELVEEFPEGAATPLPFDVQVALAKPSIRRDARAETLIGDHWRRTIWPRGIELASDLARVDAERAEIDERMVTTLIAREREMPRPAFVLDRGAYDKPTIEVQRATPAILPPMAEDLPRDRLGFAQWLVDPAHPLVARVTMNRLWQHFFGSGLVRTTEDFGVQGETPSHPALLDWLAVEFVESGWDMRHMIRLIATSDAYQRSARVTPALFEADPENRLLARGPRFRLDAESIRDSALAVSGLLRSEVGGPPVFPYQPDGLWKAVAYTDSNTRAYERGGVDDLHRRSLYTFWKRTAPPPSMAAFDAPTREACVVRRERTNTPLQALVTLNDIQFVEAARLLARRLLTAETESDDVRLSLGFRLATARTPNEAEVRELRALLAEQRAIFAERPGDAEALLSIGETMRDDALDAPEHAAWTMVASVLLNLDEFLVK